MAVISIKFNNKEENIIKNYAKTKGFSISQLIKDTLMERIAEEYDLEVCKKYLKMKVEETLVTIPFEEAIKWIILYGIIFFYSKIKNSRLYQFRRLILFEARYLSKKFLNERHKADTRLYEWITKGPHSKNRPSKFKSYK